ncbi:hypothetical protein ACA910_003186 [Epithemia clementina (nom. ined.)]
MTTQLKASLPPRQPLKADYSSQSQLVSAKKSSSLALDPEDPAPVAFLRGLFGLSGSGDRVLFNPFQTSSRKPTQENIDAYSLEAVKAIRDKNEDKLRLMISEACPPDLLLAEDVRGHTPFHYARKEHWDGWLNFLEERKDHLLKAFSTYHSPVG